MVIKSFTCSSVKIFKKSSIFRIYNIVFTIGTKCLLDYSYNNDEKLWSINQNNHDPNWPYILDHLHRILIISGSGSSKSNVLLKLMKNQRPDIGKKLFIHQRSIRIKVSVAW